MPRPLIWCIRSYRFMSVSGVGVSEIALALFTAPATAAATAVESSDAMAWTAARVSGGDSTEDVDAAEGVHSLLHSRSDLVLKPDVALDGECTATSRSNLISS